MVIRLCLHTQFKYLMKTLQEPTAFEKNVKILFIFIIFQFFALSLKI